MEIDINEVKSMLKTMSAKEASKKLGIGRAKLFSIMKENNISIREIKKSQKPSDGKIIKLYESNNIKDTAKLSGTNKHYVIKVLERNKIDRNYTKVDNLDPTQVIKYFEIHTLRECGERFGFTHEQIKRFLRKHGVDTTKHENKYPNESRKNIDIDGLIKYYQTHNIKECSKHFKCSSSLISMKLRENNIDTSIHSYKFSEETKSKISKSNKERWKNKDFRKKIKSLHTLQPEEIIENAKKFHGDKYNYSKVEPSNKQSKITVICPEHGEFKQSVYNHLNKNGCPSCPVVISNGHQGVIDFIKSVLDAKIIINDRKAISPHELDIYIPERNFAIEYHGLHWHSYDHRESTEERSRHLYKHNLCVNEGIRLMQIFENEWVERQELVKSMIKSKLGLCDRIYARKCEIEEIGSSIHSIFMNINHLQGSRWCNVAYGLFLDNQLVSVMSFNKHKKHEWEITRFANKLGTAVVGGASKLFNRFIKDHNPNQVLTYADKRHSDGNLYEKLGFEFVKDTNPNYFYIKNNKIHSRQQFMKHKLKDKLETFDPGLTEAENMFLNGYRRLWDAGHYKFIWMP